MINGAYGKELILDLHQCDPACFTRARLEKFFVGLCNRIGMQREDLYWWDDINMPEDERETEPHLVGTSAVQFIRTSNITIHTLDILGKVFLNIFSCKDFNADSVAHFAALWFRGIVTQVTVVRRGEE